MKKKKVNFRYISIIMGGVCGLLLGFFIKETSSLENAFSLNLPSLIIILIALYLSFFLQIIIHELGHLIFGLITGYEFLSYRVGNLMIIKKERKLKIKKMSLMGTGGQCLMSPPPYNSKMPYLLYNLGGVIFNIIFAIVFFILYLNNNIFLVKIFSIMMTFVGIFYAFINGIPFSSDINNDGYNILLMLKNRKTVYAFWLQMKINEQLLNDVRLKNMPKKWFKKTNDINNSLVNTILVFACNRLVDEKKFVEAYEEIDKLLNSDLKIIKIHRFQLILYGIYLELVLNLDEKYIKMYHDNEFQHYITNMKNSLDVLLINYAYILLKENNSIKAQEVKNKFNIICRTYPYESDIKSIQELLECVENIKVS